MSYSAGVKSNNINHATKTLPQLATLRAITNAICAGYWYLYVVTYILLYEHGESVSDATVRKPEEA